MHWALLITIIYSIKKATISSGFCKLAPLLRLLSTALRINFSPETLVIQTKKSDTINVSDL